MQGASRTVPLLLAALMLAEQAKAGKICREQVIPVTSQHQAKGDLRLGERVRSDGPVTIRIGGGLPTKGSPIDAEPTVTGALFADGNVLFFVNDGNPPLSISSVRKLPRACATGVVDFSRGYPQRGSDIVLDEGAGIASDRVRRSSRGGLTTIALVRGTAGSSAVRSSDVLLVTKRKIDVVGVSVPSFHGAIRTMLTVTRNDDGSITVGRYHYSFVR